MHHRVTPTYSDEKRRWTRNSENSEARHAGHSIHAHRYLLSPSLDGLQRSHRGGQGKPSYTQPGQSNSRLRVSCMLRDELQRNHRGGQDKPSYISLDNLKAVFVQHFQAQAAARHRLQCKSCTLVPTNRQGQGPGQQRGTMLGNCPGTQSQLTAWPPGSSRGQMRQQRGTASGEVPQGEVLLGASTN